MFERCIARLLLTKEGKQQLNDTTYYRRLYSDPTQEINNIIKEKLEKGVQEGNITPAELEALYNSNLRISNFYTLPKIHKISNPGQPIVNSIGSIAEKISAYVDETSNTSPN